MSRNPTTTELLAMTSFLSVEELCEEQEGEKRKKNVVENKTSQGRNFSSHKEDDVE